ncbi:MAG: ATP phosphoribosyltransferase [Bacteroidota bacterium]
MESILRIAIQKSGRLSESSLKFIKECGISFSHNKTRLKTQAHNFPLEIFFLRDDDIPKYVSNGTADLGIVGENVLLEKQEAVDTTLRLGFAKCRLSLAVRNEATYTGPESLQDKRIATSYPVLLAHYLEQQGVEAQIHEISGSVEIAPGIGLADAVCDLVSSGSTLMANGLKEVEVMLKSEAVLIQHPELSEAKQASLDQLLFRMHSVLKARNAKYILLNVPNSRIEAVSELLPGMRSPTVTPLADPDWSSLHSVINEDDFWNVIERVRGAGAEGILVVPIEKMIE